MSATMAEVVTGLNAAAALGTAILAGDGDLFGLAADGLPAHALPGSAVLFAHAAEHSLTRAGGRVPQPGEVAELWARGGDAVVISTAERYSINGPDVPTTAAWLRAVLTEDACQPTRAVALHLLLAVLCAVDLVAHDGGGIGEWRAFLATLHARVEVAANA